MYSKSMEDLVAMKEEISNYLENNGCCSRCILVFLGKSCETVMDIENSRSDSDDQIVDDNLKNGVKRLKKDVCSSCIGFFQPINDSDAIEAISLVVQKEGHDALEFGLALTLPPSLILRMYRCWANVISRFSCPILDGIRVRCLTVLKEVWRNTVGSKVAVKVGKMFSGSQCTLLKVNVSCLYDQDDEECCLLEKLNLEKFDIRRKQHRKFNSGVFTKQAISDVLKQFTDQQFLSVLPDWPSVPRQRCRVSHVQCLHSSLYIAGRYNKYSRELPQTPWMVQEGKRLHFESSVQELIFNLVDETVKGDGVKFSASGREDVDVRCLGNGRPFIMELQNPRRTAPSTGLDFGQLTKRVNGASKGLIAVRDLQLISKQDTTYLKSGEEEKTKSYCALCVSSETVVDEDALSRLTDLAPLTLFQTTPIRVLHRRPLCVRERTIYEIRGHPVDGRFFKVHLRTQAGTYIKEFIHGDFGRTNPNLRTILGVECDIVALDVESVDLNWPPAVNYS